MILLIIGLILFVGLVVIHEYGHFIMARRNGVEIEEFGIGFPPRLWKKRIHSPKGDYNFTINLLPVGGFVKMKGEHDSDTEPGTFGAATLWGKSQIMAAGVIMNLLVAFVLLTILAAIGMPKLIDNQYTVASDTKVVQNEVIIGSVEAKSPAVSAKAYNVSKSPSTGQASPILQQDHIKSITPYQNGVRGTSSTINSAKDLSKVTSANAGKTVIIAVTRSGKSLQLVTQLRSAAEVDASKKTDNPKGYLGVYPTDYSLQRSTWSSPIVAAGLIRQFTVLTFQGLGHALGGLGSIIAGAVTGNSAARTEGQTEASSQVSGPVGIFVILKDGSSLGYQFILMIIAIISLTLAIMNILPIPALDGGRLWLTLATRGIGKPISSEKEEIINASGFGLLLVLIITITVVDIRRFF